MLSVSNEPGAGGLGLATTLVVDDLTSLHIHTEKHGGRATPEFFLFCLSLAGGSFTHVVRVHVELLTP